MTPAEHEVRIDMAWRHLLGAVARGVAREGFTHAYLQAIRERNAERTPAELEQIERERGLR